jgi:hypothetical protein
VKQEHDQHGDDGDDRRQSELRKLMVDGDTVVGLISGTFEINSPDLPGWVCLAARHHHEGQK